jgi:tRNA dimethylallyltransferase
MGPTASGKTDAAIALCETYPVEIISVDSALIYSDMNIGTAKPEPALLEKYPHHLIDIRTPLDSYSAAEFCSDTQKAIEAIRQKNKIPLLVGGTMLYFKALQEGLSEVPPTDKKIREAITAYILEQGIQTAYMRLMTVDPLLAERLKPTDTQRISRGLEVFESTGKPLSFFQSQKKKQAAFSFINLAMISLPRDILHERIATRFKKMINEGLIEEVEMLQKKYPALNDTFPSMRSVGYRQVLAYLAGDYDKNTLLEKSIAATRQLAKRQLTWLRSWDNIIPYG